MALRTRLPNRRPCETFDFHHGGMTFKATAGFYRDGRIAEIFLASNKPGSAIEAVARDAAVTISIALQFGADVATIRNAITRDHNGSPATVIGAALEHIGGSP